MAHKRAHEVDQWLARPDPAITVILVYGPDRGLVTERARRFADSTGLATDDPFSVIRFDGSELETDPGRLADEAATVPMFGGNRLIWIRNVSGGKALSDRIAELSAASSPDLAILVEAGDLKKGSTLRAAVEKAPYGMALPCYADGDRDIDALIDTVLGVASLAPSPAARTALRRHLGGDRLASRGELEKLALYCHGSQTVEIDDVEAIIPDVSATTADDVVDAVLAGQVDRIDSALQRALNAGATAYPVLAAVMRQLQVIEQLRMIVEAGNGTAASAVAAARPPIFFKRKAAVEKAVAAVDSETLRRLLGRLQSGVLQTRRHGELETTLARSAVLAVGSEIGQSYSRSGHRHASI
ncbi:MAG: DNA polymerase III subunit delta [Rhizobiaceae bacterium]|nr:DNA polymerase III subunit delta [Rhizobiaceae bacterium]MCV0404657.1 DNA polymerase III subunit delta [Rhizobiaceae bacterium]